MSELLDRGLAAHGGLSKSLALTASASASIGADRLAKRGDDLRLGARDEARLRALSTRLKECVSAILCGVAFLLSTGPGSATESTVEGISASTRSHFGASRR